MNVLILSCGTGEGHNSAGKAVKEYVEARGDHAVMIDMMLLKGEKTSRAVSGVYINVVKRCPHLFGFVYQLGKLISSAKRKSPVYFACSLVAKNLRQYLEKNDFDVIVTPHLYPAETLTYMKKKGWLKQKVVAIGTDYTCIPFWEETNCDYYVVPHEDLVEEFAQKGVPRDKLLPWGIPVRLGFLKPLGKEEARKSCGLAKDALVFLVMGGSMGFGRIQIFVQELARRLEQKEEIIVICGNNEKLKAVLEKELQNRSKVTVLGFTDKVADYMAACDVIFTKPGGLSSTEAAVRQIPMIHTSPIPGCENRNLEFFQSRGMSIGRKSFFGQVKAGRKLLGREKLRQDMAQAQKRNCKPDAVKKIYDLLKELSQKEVQG